MSRFSSAHWCASAFFAAILFPLFHFAHLPFRLDLGDMGGAYWVGSGVRAVFCATFLYVLAFPWKDTVRPVIDRFYSKWWLAAVGLSFVIGMIALFGVSLGAYVIVFGIALSELMIRRQAKFVSSLLDIALPALYLFVGLLIVLSFQHAIGGLKFAGSYDPFFRGLDRKLFHADVSSISHFTLRHLPPWTQRGLELAYYSLFTQIGLGMIIVSLALGRKAGLKYVATLLAAYYIALAIFAFWPTIGPFSSCDTHASGYATALGTFAGQEVVIAKARLLLQHSTIPAVQTVNMADYFIGFPCLHVALPLIVLWSLRKWRGMALALIVLDLFLVSSIVILEWHYLVDMVAGIFVAVLAIATQHEPACSTPDKVQPNVEDATLYSNVEPELEAATTRLERLTICPFDQSPNRVDAVDLLLIKPSSGEIDPKILFQKHHNIHRVD